MKNFAEKIINSEAGAKLVANLYAGRLAEKLNGIKLTEFRYISKLPTDSLEIFNLLYNASSESNRANLAIKLERKQSIKWINRSAEIKPMAENIEILRAQNLALKEKINYLKSK